MSHVFVVDEALRPLAPVHPGRARRLLKAGTAAVFKRYPFTLILRQPVAQVAPEPLRLKIDPGSHTTGLALVGETSGKVVWAAELTHQGQAIVERCVAAAGNGTRATGKHATTTGAGKTAGCPRRCAAACRTC